MPTRHCQLPLETTGMEQLLHKETKSFLKTRKRGPPKTNYYQNGRVPIPPIGIDIGRIPIPPNFCQTARDIELGTSVQIKAFTLQEPVRSHRRDSTPVSQWKIWDTYSKDRHQASLVVKWLRILLSMQGNTGSIPGLGRPRMPQNH